MTVWSQNNPIAWVGNILYTLPVPERRPDTWREEKTTWPNLSRERRNRSYGFRFVADWRFTHLEPNQVQMLDNIINARRVVLAPWGLNAPRFLVDIEESSDLYIDNRVQVDGKEILFISVQLYPEKITVDHFIKATPIGQKFIIEETEE